MPYTCRNYEEAQAIFNSRVAVRSNKWAPNERPLEPKPRSEHRLIQGETSYGKYFDLKLYATVMARFYEPKVEDGKTVERRLYMGHPSQTSRKFMWETTHFSVGMNWCRDASGGRSDDSIIMPIYTKHFMQDEDSTRFSLDAYLVDGVLDTTRSSHTPHHRLVADNDVRKHKQRVVQLFEPYILLALMRMPEFKENCKIDSNLGHAFGGEGFMRDYYLSMRDMWDALQKEEMPRQDAVNTFFRMCQKAYDVMASKRGNKQKDFVMGNRWYTQNRVTSTVDALEKPIDTKDFRRAIVDRIQNYVGSNNLRKLQEIRQFPTKAEYPVSNIHV